MKNNLLLIGAAIIGVALLSKKGVGSADSKTTPGALVETLTDPTSPYERYVPENEPNYQGGIDPLVLMPDGSVATDEDMVNLAIGGFSPALREKVFGDTDTGSSSGSSSRSISIDSIKKALSDQHSEESLSGAIGGMSPALKEKFGL